MQSFLFQATGKQRKAVAALETFKLWACSRTTGGLVMHWIWSRTASGMTESVGAEHCQMAMRSRMILQTACTALRRSCDSRRNSDSAQAAFSNGLAFPKTGRGNFSVSGIHHRYVRRSTLRAAPRISESKTVERGASAESQSFSSGSSAASWAQENLEHGTTMTPGIGGRASDTS